MPDKIGCYLFSICSDIQSHAADAMARRVEEWIDHDGCPGQTRRWSGCHDSHGRRHSRSGELWALLFNTLHAKQEIKIVWRMTGTGDLHLTALGPQGQHLAPVWGPEAHGGSNWNRPGAEWGAGFTFPVAGCWDIHATRDDNAGDVWLMLT